MSSLAPLLLAGIAASLPSLGLAAEPASSLRTLARVPGLHASAILSEARPLAASGRHVDAWVYDDLDPSLDATLTERANVLDAVILPAVARAVGIPLPSWPTIHVVFDDLHDADRAGLMTEELWQSFAGPAITVDARLSENAFVPAAAHELAHALHRWRSGQPLTEAGTWLDEGLARWIEARVLGGVPELEVSSFFASSGTEPLEHWSDGASGGDYAQALLFVSYLYSHFGGDALLADLLKLPFSSLDALAPILARATDRDSTLSPPWLTRDALFTHFALALAINSPYLGKHQLFSLGEIPGIGPALRARTLSAPWLVPSAPIALAPLQARLFSLMPGECWCWSADRPDAKLEAYALTGEGAVTTIELTESETCATNDASTGRWLFVNRGPAVQLTLTQTRH